MRDKFTHGISSIRPFCWGFAHERLVIVLDNTFPVRTLMGSELS